MNIVVRGARNRFYCEVLLSRRGPFRYWQDYEAWDRRNSIPLDTKVGTLSVNYRQASSGGASLRYQLFFLGDILARLGIE